jgi:hypothetical protein
MIARLMPVGLLLAWGVFTSAQGAWLTLPAGGDDLAAVMENADVGPVGRVGGASYTNGVYVINGSGADIWGTNDACHYVYAAGSNDWQIATRVTGQGNTHAWAKAGLMIRESLAANARHLMVAVTPTSGVEFQRRPLTGGVCTNNVLTGWTAPLWLKVIKRGNYFAGYASSNAVDWVMVGADQMNLGEAALYGLAVSAHNNSALSQVVFEGAGAAPRDVGVTGTGDGLQGTYVWEGTAQTVSRVDGAIDFAWGTNAPVPGYNADRFQVQWTGELEAEFTGLHTLHLVTDDGCRLWLNEQLVINDWTNHPVKESRATVVLEAGQRYLVRCEYFDGMGSATAQLLWSNARTPRMPIPQSQLYSRCTDADGDGAPDLWEVRHGFNPADASDGALDVDWDGLSTADEFFAGTNPRLADTDGDGVEDRWQQRDNGNVVRPGWARETGNAFVVGGGGSDIWGTSDSFHFVFAPVTGDWQMVARVLGQQRTDGWAKAGVMMREGLDPGARHLFAALAPDYGTCLIARTNYGGTSYRWPNLVMAAPPVWLKLVRRGTQFQAQRSLDGLEWELIAEVRVALGERLYAGLAVSAHNTGAVAQVEFDHVSLVPTPVPVIGTGDGLRATFFADTNLETVAATTLHPAPDFNWSTNAPLAGVEPDEFGLRWEGELQAQYSEEYTLWTKTDDGVRVWLDGRLILENWNDHAALELAARVPLVAGQRYLLRVDYFENRGNAQARLAWSSPSTLKTTVPTSQLYSEPGDLDADGLPDLWERAFGLNPMVAAEAGLDGDGDGLTNLEEYRRGTDPTRLDTDGDGLPDGWQTRDVGAVGLAGSAQYSQGEFTLAGSGADIWETADEFRFVSQRREGDWEIVARVESLSETHAWAKAGLMIRASQAADAAHAMLVLTPGNGVSLQWRTNTGGHGTSFTPQDGLTAPGWLRLARQGNRFSGYYSTNGVSWEWVATSMADLGPAVWVGLVVSAHDDTRLASARFSAVQVAPTPAQGVVVPGRGSGLTGRYYANRHLAGEPLVRLDPVVNFDWGLNAPANCLGEDNFSVRWVGELEPLFTEAHTFHVATDDGVRLWLNEQLLIDDWYDRSVSASTVTVPLVAGQRYFLSLEAYERYGDAVAQLGWSSPRLHAVQPIPASQLFAQFTVADQDGMADAWETVQGLNPGDPADAAADPDGDGLSNLVEFSQFSNPGSPDSDEDGLPDSWEYQHGLSPVTGQDADEDADGDGLSNLQEFIGHTNPRSGDTDGDGLGDWVEVMESLTDPNHSDITEIATVAEVAGAQAATNRLGEWQVEGDGILSRRGSVEYSLIAPTADTYRIEIQGSEKPWYPVELPFLIIHLDGEYLGRIPLVQTNGSRGFARVLTPWIRAGAHTMRVFWDNAHHDLFLKIDAVRLQELRAVDANGNGMKDWVENRVRMQSGIEMGGPVIYSATSPVCLEGRGRFLSLMQIRTGYLHLPGNGNRWYADQPRPWLTETPEFAEPQPSPRPGAGFRWHTDLPLQADRVTAVEVSFQNDAWRETNRIVWKPTNLLQANNLLVRRGDALLLAVEPEGNHGGGQVAQIEIVGVTNYTPKIKDPVVHCFAQAGTFTVNAAFVPGGNKAPQTNTLQITVVAASFPAAPAAWVGKSRLWDCPDIPGVAVVQADPRLTLVNKGPLATGGRKFQITADAAEPRQVVARLGTNGPVLATVAVEGFRIARTSQTFVRQLQRYPDGSQLIETGLVLDPVLPFLTLRLDIFVGGVVFDDGTVTRTLTSQDFDALGQTTVRFVRPASARTSICHYLYIFDGLFPLGKP